MPALNQEMKDVVARVRLGFVATVCPDGTPNVSPKGTLCVLDDDHLIFADIRSPGTIANLRANQNIEINVVDSFRRKGYRFKGTAELHEKGPAFDKFVEFLDQFGMFDAPRRTRAVVVIAVRSAKPLISPGYDDGASEEEISAQWKRYYGA